ncbi:MAG: hypothetical protein AABX33_05345 [Nanoarchaeota archaeon]
MSKGQYLSDLSKAVTNSKAHWAKVLISDANAKPNQVNAWKIKNIYSICQVGKYSLYIELVPEVRDSNKKIYSTGVEFVVN